MGNDDIGGTSSVGFLDPFQLLDYPHNALDVFSQFFSGNYSLSPIVY